MIHTKCAGTPDDKAASVDLHVPIGAHVERGQPLCTVHAEAPGELAYVLDRAAANREIIDMGGPS